MTTIYLHKKYYNQVLSNKYYRLVRHHLKKIGEARNDLKDEQQLLYGTESLRPGECDDLTSKLMTLLEPIVNFEELLTDSQKLPEGVAAKRYKILLSLTYSKKHIKKIILLLSSFRTVCLESSPDVYEMFDEIRYRIKTLLRVSEVLEPETKEMLTKTLGDTATTPMALEHYINCKN